MNDGVEFTFDPGPFVQGVNKASGSLGGLLGRAGDIEKKISSGVGKAMNGLIAKVGMLFVALKSVKSVLGEMPEVGMAFGIAKDVFLKNLLWPLRQQVMPMLQRMLDWVRDNRAQFVKWGVVVANVFRTVTVVATTLWEVFKDLVRAVGSSFQDAFRTNFKTFDEFLNVLSFKVSAAIIYMGMAARELVSDLKPALDWVIDVGSTVLGFFADLLVSWTSANEQGNSLGTVMESIGRGLETIGKFIKAAAEGFREGFTPALRDAMTPVNNIVDAFNRMLNALGVGNEDGVRGAFRALGTFLGTVFQAALINIAALADGLATTLENIATAAEAIQKLFKGDVAGAGAAAGEVLRSTSKGGTKSLGEAYDVFTGESIHDGIVTKGGKVIRTDPDDNIYAFKDLGGRDTPGREGDGGTAPQQDNRVQNTRYEFGRVGMSMAGPTVNLYNSVQVSVSEGDAEQAGVRLMEGLSRGGSAMSSALMSAVRGQAGAPRGESLAEALASSRMAEGY